MTLATEVRTIGETDAALATRAGVPVKAVAMLRANIPHWSLEQKGVIVKLAAAMELDANELRARISRAKSNIITNRGHSGAASGFGGSFPPRS